MMLPADQKPALPLHPAEEPLDDPPALRPAQATTVLRPRPTTVAAVRRDHLHAPLPQRRVQRIAVARLVPDQVRRRVLRERQVQRQLHQRRLVRARRMRAQRQRKSAAVHDRHDLHALARLGASHARAAALRPCERRVDVRLRAVEQTPPLRFARQVLEHAVEHARPCPGLKSPVHGLVVRVALRQKFPLRARVEDPLAPPRRRAGQAPWAARAVPSAWTSRESGGESAPTARRSASRALCPKVPRSTAPGNHLMFLR